MITMAYMLRLLFCLLGFLCLYLSFWMGLFIFIAWREKTISEKLMAFAFDSGKWLAIIGSLVCLVVPFVVKPTVTKTSVTVTKFQLNRSGDVIRDGQVVDHLHYWDGGGLRYEYDGKVYTVDAPRTFNITRSSGCVDAVKVTTERYQFPFCRMDNNIVDVIISETNKPVDEVYE